MANSISESPAPFPQGVELGEFIGDAEANDPSQFVAGVPRLLRTAFSHFATLRDQIDEDREDEDERREGLDRNV